MFKDLQKQNSFMKKELDTLKKDNNDDEIRLIIETYNDKAELTEQKEESVQDYESENTYELV
jgi:hypothetical protein